MLRDSGLLKEFNVSLVRPHLEYSVQARFKTRASKINAELCELEYKKRIHTSLIPYLSDRRVRVNLILKSKKF